MTTPEHDGALESHQACVPVSAAIWEGLGHQLINARVDQLSDIKPFGAARGRGAIISVHRSDQPLEGHHGMPQ